MAMMSQHKVECLGLPSSVYDAFHTAPSMIIQSVVSTHCALQIKNHVDLMETLDLVDFDSASDVSGSKFYYLRNAAALLELALVNYTMQVPSLRPTGTCSSSLPSCSDWHVA